MFCLELSSSSGYFANYKGYFVIFILFQVSQGICGRTSAGLQLSAQGQTILYIQHFHEAARSRVAAMLEAEKWRKFSCSRSLLEDFCPPLASLVHPGIENGERNDNCDKTRDIIHEITLQGAPDSFSFVESMVTFLSILSSYCGLLQDLPASACVEVALKISDLLKLFNSRL